MDMNQRDEEICRMRREGIPLSQIAKRFDISRTRAEQIFRQRQDKEENYARWPPLKRMLPARVQNILIKVFGSEEILNNPERLASMGPEVFGKWRNMGRKSIKQLMEALESLGFSVNQSERMSNPQCQVYFKIGKAILRDYFDYYVKNSLDDAEYSPIVRIIIEGIAKEMQSSGMGMLSCNELTEKLKAFNRQIYQNLRVRQVEEDRAQFNMEKG